MTAYGGGRGRTLFDRDAPAPSRPRSDRRYHTSKWRRTSKAVLVRDGYRCMIDERCPHIARVVDHIRPVYPGMPDAEFYDRRNLRAACVPHNVARGFERFERRHATRPLDTNSPPTLFGDYTRRDKR